MKKQNWMLILCIILILLIGFFVYANFKDKGDNITEKQILLKVFPIIQEYCNQLDNQAGGDMPTCDWRTQNITYYRFVTDIDPYSSPQYRYYKKGGAIIVLANLGLIYGRNDYSGHVNVSFILDRDLRMINKSMPIKGSIYSEKGQENIGYF